MATYPGTIHSPVWSFLTRITDSLYTLRSTTRRQQATIIDSWALWGHYRASVAIFFLVFVIVTCGWYSQSPMECVSLKDRSEVSEYLQQLCLSYSFTNSTRWPESEVHLRVYAAHYRWIHWVTLFLMYLYYLPLIVARNCSVPIINQLLLDIKGCKHQDTEQLRLAFIYVEELGWYSFVFLRHLLCHLFALVVNIICIFIIDTLFNNQFLLMVPAMFPFSRDLRYFSDPLSLLFPPFVMCKVGPEMMLLNYRTETIGCHLPLMEFYEKIFIFLWLWMSMLLIITILKIISILVLGVCKAWQRSLVAVSIEKQVDDVTLLTSRVSIGDLILMSQLREVLDAQTYRLALHHAARVVWPDCYTEEDSCYSPPTHMPSDWTSDSMKL